MYVQRYIADKTKEAAKYFASITIYGLRQIGKSTLISKIFPEFQYVTLDDIEIRNYALNDPKGFLRNYSTPLIIDKIQKAPNLLEYIKIQIGETKYQELFNNENPKPLYVLSSSNQFEPQQAIAESLTGRTCIFRFPIMR